MKPDTAKNQAWGAFGAHSGVFPKIPARDFFLGAIYFRGKCAPNAPQSLAGPGAVLPKRWAIARPRIVGYRGSAHPPAEPPGRRDPERRCAGGCRAGGQPAAHSPGGPCRGGASAPRWRPRAFSGHRHGPGGTPRALPVFADSWTGRASCYPAPGFPSFDPLPFNLARPIRANGLQPMRAAPAACPIQNPKPVSGDDHIRRIPHARPDSRFLV